MELIYKNTKEIETINSKYNNYCNILNENAEKIIAFNDYLNNKDFIIYTLFFSKYRIEIYNIITDIVKRESKFYTQELVTSIYRESEHKLLHNEYERNGQTMLLTDNSKADMNIKQIAYVMIPSHGPEHRILTARQAYTHKVKVYLYANPDSLSDTDNFNTGYDEALIR